MASQRPPPVLHVWMLLTRCFAWPMIGLYALMHRRMGGDPKRFSERLGRGASHARDPVIWFHAASLGEVMQIAPLARHLMRSDGMKILVTTNTVSGAHWVARHMSFATHRFAPIDTPAAVKGFLDGWPIALAVFVEGDLWPRLLRGLHTREVPRILLNARHSRTRARFPAASLALLEPFVAVTCRSESIAQDIRALGLPADKVHVLPDLRLTHPKLVVQSETHAPLARAIGSRPVWLAASTHPADEDAVLAAHQDVLAAFPDALLILAPRHPIRGTPLQKLAHAKALRTAQRSLGEGISVETQVYIADTLGELGVFFTLSPITFMGGSFGREGGHNPFEPAHFETAIVHGPRVKNFVDAYEALRVANAACQVEHPEQLGQTITRLLTGDKAKEMAKEAHCFMRQTDNSLNRYADLVGRALSRVDRSEG